MWVYFLTRLDQPLWKAFRRPSFSFQESHLKVMCFDSLLGKKKRLLRFLLIPIRHRTSQIFQDLNVLFYHPIIIDYRIRWIFSKISLISYLVNRLFWKSHKNLSSDQFLHLLYRSLTLFQRFGNLSAELTEILLKPLDWPYSRFSDLAREEYFLQALLNFLTEI